MDIFMVDDSAIVRNNNKDMDLILKLRMLLTHYEHSSSIPKISFFDNFVKGYSDSDDVIRDLYSKSLLNNYEIALLNSLKLTTLQPSCSSGDEVVFYLKDRTTVALALEMYNNKDGLDELLYFINSNVKKRKRSDLEYNTKCLQIIPYINVVHNGRTLLLKKIKGDARTYGKYDFPAGHWNHQDKTIQDCIRKELSEELGIHSDKIKSSIFRGAIPLSNNIFSVSYYHLGLIYTVTLQNDTEIFNAEPEKHQISYLSDLSVEDICKFDNWLVYSLNKIKEEDYGKFED